MNPSQTLLTKEINGQQNVAVPTAQTTPQQQAAAVASGWKPSQISSSGMAQPTSQTGNALTSGGNALTSTGTPKVNYSSFDSNGNRTDYDMNGNPIRTVSSGVTGVGSSGNTGLLTPEQMTGQADTLAKKAFASIDAIYNQQLANENDVYANAIQQLKDQTKTQHAAWEATATALNPYASSRTSSNLTQHHEVIDNKAEALAADLTQKASQAKLALQMGRSKDYLALQQSMQKMVQDYQTDLNAERWKQANFLQQDRQINNTETNMAADNFRGLLSEALPPVEEINNMIKNGSIQNSPLFKEALKAGYTPEGALTLIQSAAKAKEDKTGLEWAKFDLQLKKAEDAANKQSQAQIQAAVINSVASVPRPASGASPAEWADYYKTIASKTAGGKTDFRISQDFSNLQTIIPQLGNIKTAIEGLRNTDPLTNLIAGKMPWSEKNKQLEAYLNSAAAPLARLFGEKGTLAEGDVNRIKLAIGNATSPEVVREKVFNSIIDIVGEKFFNNLENYANQGYNVSAYAKDVQDIQQFKQDTKLTNNTVSYQGKTYSFPTKEAMQQFINFTNGQTK